MKRCVGVFRSTCIRSVPLISYIREAPPGAPGRQVRVYSSWKTARFFEKKTIGKQFGFSSGILIDKIEANGAPGNALTAPEDRRLAPQSPLRKTAGARDAPG